MAKTGRKPKFDSPEQMQAIIDQYFVDCRGHPYILDDGKPLCDKYGIPVILDARPPTVTGLALALGFNGRQSLLDYQAKEAFADTITRAKARVEEYCEARLFDKDGARGAEFALKYNFRWAPPEDKKKDDEADGAVGVVVLAPVMDNPGPPEGEAYDAPES